MWKSAGRAPCLRVLPWHLPYNWGKKARKTLSQGKKNLSHVKKNLSQSTVYILPKHPHITKPSQTHTLQNPHIHTHKHTHTLKNNINDCMIIPYTVTGTLSHLCTQTANPSRLVAFEKLIVPQLKSRDNLLAGWTVQDSYLSRVDNVLSSPKRPDRLWRPHSLLFNGYLVLCLPGVGGGVKRPGREI
jgi:hypothetical protein